MSSNTLSIILYITVGLFCILLSMFSKRMPKFAFWSIVLILSLLAGLRHDTVGVDTKWYMDALQTLRYGFVERLVNVNEQGFLWLSYIIVHLSKGYTLLLFVISFITNYFIIKRIILARDHISVPLAIFIYYFQFCFMTFNTLRQWISLAIVFYFSRYLEKGNKGMLIFLVAVLVAMLFHNSALVALAYIPIYLFIYSRRRGRKFQLIRLGMFLTMPFLAIAVYVYFSLAYGEVYGVATVGELSLVTVLRIGFLLFIVVYLNHALKTRRYHYLSERLTVAEKEKIKYENLVYLIGLVITFMVILLPSADRIGQYFILMELLVLPRYAKFKPCRKITIAYTLFFVSYLRIMSFATNGYHELPYLPFWYIYI